MNLVSFIFYSLFSFLLLFNCGSMAGLDDTEPQAEPKRVIDYTQPGAVFQSNSIDEKALIEDRLAQMTIDEKIGQLMWINVNSNKGREEINYAKKLVKDYHVGGIIWFRDTKKPTSPYQQVVYTNELQKAARYPLIVSIDGEWGPNMRLDSTIQFPRQLQMGAISDNQLVYDFGVEVGRELKQMGIHFNFAPVVDVNNNPQNPVINDRSFGEDKYNVADKGVAYMRGMHDAGILCTAKHFPGHGDTDTDSHLDLPVINHDRNRLYDIELYPFRRLIENRLGGMMVAHLSVPALDATVVNRPTTLSPSVVTDLLQHELGFDGLIVTDAMNMQGVAKHYPSGRAEVEALKAGNDILLYPRDVRESIAAIKAAINTGELTEYRIDQSVRKVLAAKNWLGILDQAQQVPTSGVTAFLNRPEAQKINQKLQEQSMTLVNNLDYQLPFSDLSTYSFASVGIDNGNRTPFQKALQPYAPMEHFSISATAGDADFRQLLGKLSKYNKVIVGLENKSSYARKGFGITEAEKAFLAQLESQGKLVLVVFGNPYSLKYFENYRNLVCAYDDDAISQKAAAEALFGAIGFQGRMPVRVNNIPLGAGQITAGSARIRYTNPQAFNLTEADFYTVDSIANDAIKTKAIPGCVIMIAKDNKVVYQKAYGYHTYYRRHKTDVDDIWDLASITKIAASTPAIMMAYDEGKLNTDQTLSDIIPELSTTNKGNMKLGEILNHTAGLKSWIPFYKTTVKDKKPLTSIYRTTPADGYRQVAKNVYIRDSYEKDSMLLKIATADNNLRGRYVYSDLGYYYFKAFFERTYQKPFDQYIDEKFYSRVGFPTFTYNPLNKFSASRIVPTEKDDYFRNQELQGYVHDMGAAMQGGVGGHAGLFGSANDLVMYMQLLLNKGSYGNVQYFQPSTVDFFTRRYNTNSRKGLGFDKPEFDPNRSGPTCSQASADSFGHTGFTGTFTWADPQNNLIVIFLSNRTYPTASNNKLLTQNVRPKIQEEIYKIFEGK